MTTAVRMPDGTICRKGATCKRHGTKNTSESITQRTQELETKIGSLLKNVSATTTPEDKASRPEWWSEYHEQNFGYKVQVFQQFGLKEASVPTFYEPATRGGYISVNTDDDNTKLFVNTDGIYAIQGHKYYCRAWMYKDGKPVAMLRFATYPLDYVPEDTRFPYVESVICDIEVRKEYTGNGYAMEVIRHVEKNILAGRLIHSGGHYTPEGEKSLGGKLPYTAAAKYEYKKVFARGEIPKSSFDSMEFVHDWDDLTPLR